MSSNVSAQTRLFHLTWDNSKMPRLDYDFRMQKREADGVQFANGIVVVDLGIVYDNLGDMERTLNSYGTMKLVFADEEEPDHAQAS